MGLDFNPIHWVQNAVDTTVNFFHNPVETVKYAFEDFIDVSTSQWGKTVQAIEDIPSSLENLPKSVVKIVEDTPQAINDYAQAVKNNPLPLIETIALTWALGPSGFAISTAANAAIIASAAVTAANGGDVKQVATAAAMAYAGGKIAQYTGEAFSPTNPEALQGMGYTQDASGNWINPETGQSVFTNNLSAQLATLPLEAQKAIQAVAVGASAPAAIALFKGGSLKDILTAGLAGGITGLVNSELKNAGIIDPNKLSGKLVSTNVSAVVNAVLNGQDVTKAVVGATGNILIASGLNSAFASVKDSYKQLIDTSNALQQKQDEAKNIKAEADKVYQEKIQPNLAIVDSSFKSLTSDNQSTYWQAQNATMKYNGDRSEFNGLIEQRTSLVDQINAAAKATNDSTNQKDYDTNLATYNDLKTKLASNDTRMTQLSGVLNDEYAKAIDLNKQVIDASTQLANDVKDFKTNYVDKLNNISESTDLLSQVLDRKELNFGNDLGTFTKDVADVVTDGIQQTAQTSEAQSEGYKSLNDYQIAKQQGYPDSGSFYNASYLNNGRYTPSYSQYQSQMADFEKEAPKNGWGNDVAGYIVAAKTGLPEKADYDYAKANNLTQSQFYDAESQGLSAEKNLEKIAENLPIHDQLAKIVSEANKTNDWSGAIQKMNDAIEEATNDPKSGLVDAGNGMFANKATNALYTKDANGAWTTTFAGNKLPDGTYFQGVGMDADGNPTAITSKLDANNNRTYYVNGQEGVQLHNGRYEVGAKLGDVLENYTAGQQIKLADGTVGVVNDGGRIVTQEQASDFQQVLSPKYKARLNDIVNDKTSTYEELNRKYNSIYEDASKDPNSGLKKVDDNLWLSDTGRTYYKDDKGDWQVADVGEKLPDGTTYNGVAKDDQGNTIVITGTTDSNGNVTTLVNGENDYKKNADGTYSQLPSTEDIDQKLGSLFAIGGENGTGGLKSLFGSSSGNDYSGFRWLTYGTQGQQNQTVLIQELEDIQNNPNVSDADKTQAKQLLDKVQNTPLPAKDPIQTDIEAKKIEAEKARQDAVNLKQQQADAQKLADYQAKQEADAKAAQDKANAAYAKTVADAKAAQDAADATQKAIDMQKAVEAKAFSDRALAEQKIADDNLAKAKEASRIAAEKNDLLNQQLTAQQKAADEKYAAYLKAEADAKAAEEKRIQDAKDAAAAEAKRIYDEKNAAEAKRIQDAKDAAAASTKFFQDQKDAAEAKRIQDQKDADAAEAKRIQDQKDADAAEAKRIQDQKDAALEIQKTVDAAKAKAAQDAADAKAAQDAKNAQEATAAAKYIQDQKDAAALAEAKRIQDAADAKAKQDAVDAKARQDAADAKAAQDAADAQKQADDARRLADATQRTEDIKQAIIAQQNADAAARKAATMEAIRIQREKDAAAVEAKRIQDEKDAAEAKRIQDAVTLTGTSGTVDTGTVDTGTVDTGTVDTGTSGTVATGTSGTVATGTSGTVDTGTVDTGTSGTVDTGTSGTVDTGTSGIGYSGTSGTVDTGTSGTVDTGTSGTVDTGTSGYSGASGTVDTGTSGTVDTGTSGTVDTGTSGYSGASGTVDTGTSGIGYSGTSGTVDTGTSGTVDTGTSGSGTSGSGTSGSGTSGSGTSGSGTSGSGTSGSGTSGSGRSGSGYSGSGTGTGTGGINIPFGLGGTGGFKYAFGNAQNSIGITNAKTDNTPGATFMKGTQIKSPLADKYDIPTIKLDQIPQDPKSLEELQNAKMGGIMHKAVGGTMQPIQMRGKQVGQHANLSGMKGPSLFQQGGYASSSPVQMPTVPGMPEGHDPKFFSEGGLNSLQNTYVTGGGDGTSDSIPAMLANGEFVIPADVVSSLGNGSNDSGAKILDEFLKVVRSHKQKHDAKHLPPDSKGPLGYLAEAKRKVKK
jgi:hypothetical protein